MVDHCCYKQFLSQNRAWSTLLPTLTNLICTSSWNYHFCELFQLLFFSYSRSYLRSLKNNFSVSTCDSCSQLTFLPFFFFFTVTQGTMEPSFVITSEPLDSAVAPSKKEMALLSSPTWLGPWPVLAQRKKRALPRRAAHPTNFNSLGVFFNPYFPF